MNRKIIVETVVAIAVVTALGIGVSSGLSSARSGGELQPDAPRAISQPPTLDAKPVADVIAASPDSSAVAAGPYNASGEASFTAAGDLVHTP